MQAIYERSAIVCVSKNMHRSLVYSMIQSDLVDLNFTFEKSEFIENCVFEKDNNVYKENIQKNNKNSPFF
jgi:uncharacterized membrane protein